MSEVFAVGIGSVLGGYTDEATAVRIYTNALKTESVPVVLIPLSRKDWDTTVKVFTEFAPGVTLLFEGEYVHQPSA